MPRTFYNPTARLVVRPGAPKVPFTITEKNYRNKIWFGFVAYVSVHPEGMSVSQFRFMARDAARGVKGDMDIDIYIGKGLIDLVDT